MSYTHPHHVKKFWWKVLDALEDKRVTHHKGRVHIHVNDAVLIELGIDGKGVVRNQKHPLGTGSLSVYPPEEVLSLARRI